MADEKYEKKKVEDNSSEKNGIKPDPETTHTTDPQEHMEGPLSSLMQNTADTFEGKGDDNDSSKQ